MDVTTYLKVIGSNIRRLRGSMKQQELAEKAGVSRSTLSSIENGKSIELDNLLKIAKALGIDPANLFLSEDDRQEVSHKLKLLLEGAFKAIYPNKK